MKNIATFFKNHFAVVVAVTALALTAATGIATAQNNKGPVKVKIVKIVDGDTTTIEKTMDETSVQDFTKQFENTKGENVQVIITVEDSDKDKSREKRDPSSGGKGKTKKENSSMHFNFDMDSVTAKAFGKALMFSVDSLEKGLNFNDSLFKNLPKNFNFDFDFDDEGMVNDFDFDFNIDTDDDGTVTIKNEKGETIVIKGDGEDGVSISKPEDNNARLNDPVGQGKTKTKTIVINDEKGKAKKKVIVSTSVIVMDMDDKDDDVYKSGKKKSKEEANFNFYPNPSDGNFVLDLEMNGKDDAQVKITDMNGKEVYNEKISGNGKVSKSIGLSGKKGTFIVTIKQGKKTTNKKIIIE